ncbi:MAG: NADPH-dependent FMN reductase [Hyphomicrobiales bacterium]
MKILAFSGSLRKGSTNTGLLRAAADMAPSHVEITIAEWSAIPIYDGDEETANGVPDSVEALATQMREADGFLFSVPEYNFSIPGGFKNAIDWLSRVKNQPFAGKPSAIMGSAAGPMGTGRMQYELRKVLGALGADLILKPEVFVGAAFTKFDDEGRFTDEDGRKFIAQLVDALTAKIKS